MLLSSLHYINFIIQQPKTSSQWQSPGHFILKKLCPDLNKWRGPSNWRRRWQRSSGAIPCQLLPIPRQRQVSKKLWTVARWQHAREPKLRWWLVSGGNVRTAPSSRNQNGPRDSGGGGLSFVRNQLLSSSGVPAPACRDSTAPQCARELTDRNRPACCTYDARFARCWC
jgi:hypothetical protein